MTNFTDKIIIAVGGSLLVPDTIDIGFMQKFTDIVKNLVKQGYQVIVVPGGGKTARIYQQALSDLGIVNYDAADWVGIKAIHMNCELIVHTLIHEAIQPSVIYQPDEIAGVESAVVIKAAFQPGSSSDMGAVRMAEISGAKRIINFSNTSHVYSADPCTNPDATKFETLSWDEYRNLIPSEWTPGMSAPFDPVASRKAQEYDITVAVLGASIENLENYLAGNEFEGTIIS